MNDLGKLIKLLLENGRVEEAKEAVSNPAKRDELLEFYGITKFSS